MPSKMHLSGQGVGIQSRPVRVIAGTEGVQQVCGGNAVTVVEQWHQDICVHR